MPELDLDAIEQRANAATPGPWTAHAEDIFYPNEDEDRGPVSSLLGGGEAGHVADAEFMAHARQDIPALLAEVRKLRARIADAVAEWDASKYGDPEAPFRMRAHIDREHLGTDFNVSETNVPLREEAPRA